jgi:uncharacterized membrane protein YccC
MSGYARPKTRREIMIEEQRQKQRQDPPPTKEQASEAAAGVLAMLHRMSDAERRRTARDTLRNVH